MKTFNSILSKIGIGVMMLGAISWLPVSAQVLETKHNLSSVAGADQVSSFSGTDQVCVFCHTPHGSDTTASVPLWNRTLAAPASYTTYDSLGTSSMDGGVTEVGSVSIACLSCHDGTQAMDTVLNEPGSGSVVTAFSTNGVWTGNAAATAGVIPDTIARIGTDLTNDHPIGVQYAGGGITTTTLTGNDVDFKAAVTDNLNGNQVWWVDTGTTGTGTREKTDMILYTRTVAALQNQPEPFVECASCHDPHTANPTFLRISNDGSAVCLACHTK